MAITKKKYKTLSTDPRTRTHEFLVDSVADLDKLPKETGSAALVASIGDIYVCNNAKEWKNISNTGMVETLEPTGTINITQNGTVDVTEYATANVNISNSGGSTGTTDLYLWNMSKDSSQRQILPNKIQYLSSIGEEQPSVFVDLEFEQITETYDNNTAYGVHIHDVPVGSLLSFTITGFDNVNWGSISFGYSKLQNTFMTSDVVPNNIGLMPQTGIVPMPLDNWLIVGIFGNNDDSSMPAI